MNRNKSVLITIIVILTMIVATLVVVLITDGKDENNNIEEKESYVDVTADLEEKIEEKLRDLYYIVDIFGTTSDFNSLLSNQQKLSIALDRKEEVITSRKAFMNFQEAFGPNVTLNDENLVCEFSDYNHFTYDEATNTYINNLIKGDHGHGISFGMNEYSIESIIYETKTKEYKVKSLVLFAEDCGDVCGPVSQYYKDAALTIPVGNKGATADNIFISKKSELKPITFTFVKVNDEYALVKAEI